MSGHLMLGRELKRARILYCLPKNSVAELCQQLNMTDRGGPMAIKRIWHGWTAPENADIYQRLLHDEVFPGIEAKNIPGYRSIELLRRSLDDEVEFITIMTFDSIQNVVDFQGKDYQRCYVPDAAQKILKRWNQVSDHYDLEEVRNYD